MKSSKLMDHGPLRRVVTREFMVTRYNRRGEGSYFDTLECGHIVRAKQSAGQPSRRRCRRCRMEDGT